MNYIPLIYGNSNSWGDPKGCLSPDKEGRRYAMVAWLAQAAFLANRRRASSSEVACMYNIHKILIPLFVHKFILISSTSLRVFLTPPPLQK